MLGTQISFRKVTVQPQVRCCDRVGCGSVNRAGNGMRGKAGEGERKRILGKGGTADNSLEFGITAPFHQVLIVDRAT